MSANGLLFPFGFGFDLEKGVIADSRTIFDSLIERFECVFLGGTDQRSDAAFRVPDVMSRKTQQIGTIIVFWQEHTMRTSRNKDSRFWLRFGFLMVIISAFPALLFTVEIRQAEAAIRETLSVGQKLNIYSNGCDLSVLSSSASRLKVICIGWPTATPTATLTPTATETATATETPTEIPTAAPGGVVAVISENQGSGNAVSAGKQDTPDRKRTINPGQLVKVQANNCKLQVKTNTASRVVLVCVALPKPTPTKGTPTVTPAPGGPDGKWAGKTTNQGRPVQFYVTDNRTKFNSFYMEIYWVQCLVKITGAGPYPIDGDKLQIGVSGLSNGSLTIVGTFTSNSNIDGVLDAHGATITGCGTIDGQGGWNAKWVGTLSPIKASGPEMQLRVVDLQALPK